MSGYSASCPSCGAPVTFSLGTTLLKICDHCGSAVARKGVNLEDYGKVAQLIPTPSVLALGLKGGYEGAPGFELIGRLQVDHGTGTWDEWLLSFGGDSWAWLSESQGQFHYMGQAPAPPVPAFEDLRVGQTIDLGPPGVFVVTEARSGRFVSGQGELPFAVVPGSELHYADLSGPQGQFATLDYGTGSELETLYVGRKVALDEMGLTPVRDDERLARAQGRSLSCTQCGGPLEVRCPDLTQRIACAYCGSLLDATKSYQVIAKLTQPPFQPDVPLGARGTLFGVEWLCIGAMERSVTVEGVRYPWREHLLYEPAQGFRWLVESKGHWSFVEPANAGDVQEAVGNVCYHDGKRYKHFQSGEACVDHVLGEFYWGVRQGDLVVSHDYVCPPFMLSRESNDEEITWSRGVYVEPDEVWKAFGLQPPARARQGVGAIQPWRWAQDAPRVYAWGLLFAGLLLVLFVGFSIFGGGVVHRQNLAVPVGAASGSPEAAAFTAPFVVERAGNLEVAIEAPVSNSWMYFAGALINDEDGGLDEFDADVEYYFGSDSDGSWSEGSTTARRYVASVPAGRYTLRLEPQWEPGKKPPAYNVTVRSRVTRFYWFLLAGLAVAAWPLLLGLMHMRLEGARWSESDHSWSASSDDEDEDEE